MSGIVHPRIGNKSSGAPRGKDTEIVIFRWDHVQTKAPRDSKGVKMQGNIVFKDGMYATQVYATSSSISLPRGIEGDEDKGAYTQVPEFSHPGSPLELEELQYNLMNKPLGVAVKVGACDGEEPYYKVYGTACNPLRLIVEGQDDNEGVADIMRFEMSRPSSVPPGRYYGTWTFDSATVVLADATTVDVTNGDGEYQLTDNAAPTEITGLTNAVNGGKYTLLGSGGTNPATIQATGNFILLEGADWQGLSGERLTLQAFKDGASSFKFFELSRS
ncbi:hypothetical protein JCM19294_1132 [Nonlabens tegetincola]|uniref:Uncharacterized protein n=1 Tax=Nonlabens tegetincola TaxID=323273 RepID=A0A090Q502_9FLAO|nr:hypothetical protein [Nonlabens tegetincola]GAK96823.1 hypothetical protein JCM19294_1132 [Nonlabens tegetincola]